MNSGGPPTARRPEDRRAPDSPARQNLLTLISLIGFGRIENLTIRSGQPVLDPRPRITRERLLGARDEGASDHTARTGCKPHVRELLAELDRIGEGVIDCLEVRHGLPFRITVVDPPQGKEASS